ncbi:MAG: CotS family spore coat protein [Bacillota bacterium]|nr:CotS family spore coat protein [Bacillota bacterium]
MHSQDENILSEDSVKRYVLPAYNLQYADISQIKIKNTDKQRAVYKVSNDGKYYCLKKVYFPIEELLFVYSAIEWLYRFDVNVPRILATIDNNRFVSFKNRLFILTPWIDGGKCDYDNMLHVRNSILNLGKMHKVTENFHPIPGSICRKGLENISSSLNRHFQQLLIYSNFAYKFRDTFSSIFLDYFDNCIRLAEISAEISDTIDRKKLSQTLCHLDYVNKNIIFDKNDNIWVIDFDKCKIDYCVHDLAYYFRRLLKRDSTDWNLDLLLNSLNNYEKYHPLNLDEYKYLLVYLSFPQKYWKISKDYYSNIKKCNKKYLITLLEKSVNNCQHQLNFVEEFKNIIEEKFNVKLMK